jgi:hypothetical protein
VITDLLDRDPPVLLAVGLYGLLLASLVGWAAYAFGRSGAPWRWSAAQSYGFVALAIVGSFGWWWVDAPVEGPATWIVSDRHGVTHGDFLAVPALAAAAIVLIARWVGSHSAARRAPADRRALHDARSR